MTVIYAHNQIFSIIAGQPIISPDTFTGTINLNISPSKPTLTCNCTKYINNIYTTRPNLDVRQGVCYDS